MKDNELNEKFGEYFEGVTPPEGITADAKKLVVKKNPPRYLKYLSVAASFLIVCAASLTVLLSVQPWEKKYSDSSPGMLAPQGPQGSMGSSSDNEVLAPNEPGTSFPDVSASFADTINSGTNLQLKFLENVKGKDLSGLVKSGSVYYNTGYTEGDEYYVKYVIENYVVTQIECTDPNVTFLGGCTVETYEDTFVKGDSSTSSDSAASANRISITYDKQNKKITFKYN